MLFLVGILFASCLKTISDEGVSDSFVMQGCVYENVNGDAVENMHVLVTDGKRVGNQCNTALDGSFQINVTYEQIESHYFIRLTADSLYKSTDIQFPSVAYGTDEYQLPVFYVDGPERPKVLTDTVSDITTSTAICRGNVFDDGRSAVRERGFCWGTTPQPTISNDTQRVGYGTGQFLTRIEGLTKGTVYYVRAFARNGEGTSYGDTIRFATSSGKPTVVISSVTNVTQNSITCKCRVVSDNGFEVTSRGVYYSSISNPPTNLDDCVTNGSGTGEYIITITGLQSGTFYYIRAFATNREGDGYSETKRVKTSNAKNNND